MNDNPLLGFIVIVLAMLVGYAINVIHRRKNRLPRCLCICQTAGDFHFGYFQTLYSGAVIAGSLYLAKATN